MEIIYFFSFLNKNAIFYEFRDSNPKRKILHFSTCCNSENGSDDCFTIVAIAFTFRPKFTFYLVNKNEGEINRSFCSIMKMLKKFFGDNANVPTH